jgi:hypothetical protein
MIQSTRNFNINLLQWVLRLLPGYALCNGLLKIANKTVFGILLDWSTLPKNFSSEVARDDFIYLVVTSIGYYLLVFLYEYITTK